MRLAAGVGRFRSALGCFVWPTGEFFTSLLLEVARMGVRDTAGYLLRPVVMAIDLPGARTLISQVALRQRIRNHRPRS